MVEIFVEDKDNWVEERENWIIWLKLMVIFLFGKKKEKKRDWCVWLSLNLKGDLVSFKWRERRLVFVGLKKEKEREINIDLLLVFK